MKPIKLYTHVSGPNGWKVNILLRELELPFEQIFMEFDAMKQEPFLSLTPNGRVPVIEDPNTNVSSRCEVVITDISDCVL